jgi:hypothetical protein
MTSLSVVQRFQSAMLVMIVGNQNSMRLRQSAFGSKYENHVVGRKFEMGQGDRQGGCLLTYRKQGNDTQPQL